MATITQQEISLILQQSLDLVFIVNPEDLSLMFVNETAANWLGFDADELEGKQLEDYLPEVSAPELNAIIDGLNFTEDSGCSLVTVVKRELGDEHEFEFKLKMVKLNDKEYILASGRDIAERLAFTDEVHSILADAQLESAQDKTTELYQRDSFLEIFRSYLDQVGSEGIRLALVVIDLKNLHDINAKFGQAVGDQILRRLGALLNKAVGEEDICARFSGRKLSILLPDKGQQDALVLAEKINKTLARAKFGKYEGLAIHTNVGVAEIPEAHPPELLLDKVINQLRKVKNDEPQQLHRLGLLYLE